MEDHFRKLKAIFDALKDQFPALQAQLQNVNRSIQAGELAEASCVDALRALLAEHARLAADLRSVGERLSITIPPSMEDIEDQILALEARQNAQRLLSIVHSYFRLTAQGEDISTALEATKQALREKCADPRDEFAQELLPYSAVVRKAEAPEHLLLDDEFDLIDSRIGRKIARASDRGQLTIDPKADIGPYLDGVCEWLRPQECAEAQAAGETPAREFLVDAANARSGFPGGQPWRAVTERERAGEAVQAEASSSEGAAAQSEKPERTGDADVPETIPEAVSLDSDAPEAAEAVAGDACAEASGDGEAAEAVAGDVCAETSDNCETAEAAAGDARAEASDSAEAAETAGNESAEVPYICEAAGAVAGDERAEISDDGETTEAAAGDACAEASDDGEAAEAAAGDACAEASDVCEVAEAATGGESAETPDGCEAAEAAAGDACVKASDVCEAAKASASGESAEAADICETSEAAAGDACADVSDVCEAAEAAAGDESAEASDVWEAAKALASGESAEASDGCEGTDPPTGVRAEPGSARWEAFDGYLSEGASFTISEDTASGQLASKLFEKHMHKTRGGIAGVIYALAKERLCSDEEIDDGESQFSTVPLDMIGFMERQGYLRRIDFTNGGLQKRYWTLSSKGWACFTKKEVAEKLKRMELYVNPRRKRDADQWSALEMARYAELYRYMLAIHDEYSADHINDFVFANFGKNKETVYIPAIFSKGSEDMDAWRAYLAAKEDVERFIIIVRSASDAKKVYGALAETDRIAQEGGKLPLAKIRFVRVDQPGRFFVPDGEEADATPDAAKNPTLAASKESSAPVAETSLPETPASTEVASTVAASTEAVPTEAASMEAASKEAASTAAASTEATSAKVASTEVMSTEAASTEASKETASTVAASTEAVPTEAASTEAARLALDVNPATTEGEKISCEDAARIRQYLDGAWHVQLAGRTDAAAVMIKALALRDPKLRTLADQFARATGDPSLQTPSNSNELQAVFSVPAGTDAVADTLAAAAYLRMYFSSAASEQTYLSRDISHQRENLALRRFPDLKDALFSLADWVKYQQRGLDAELIELLLQNHDAGEKQMELQKRAREFLSRRLTESSHSDRRIKRNRENLFGSGSDINRLLNAVQENDLSVKPLAEEFIGRNIDKIIDEAWDEANRQLKFSRTDNCVGVERMTLTKQIKNISLLVGDWITIHTAESHISNKQTGDAEKLIEKLKPRMQSTLEALAVKDAAKPLALQAAESVLAGAVRDCLDRITGKSTQERQANDYYINLLKEPLIALDELDQPKIEAPDEEVEPFDFCRRAMKYLDAPERGWSDVLNRIFAETGSDHTGMDYGCAKVLNLYLMLTGQEELWKPEYSIENAVNEAIDKTSIKRNSVAIWEQDFTARLEMADGDNWFDADQNLREHIQKVLIRQKEDYYYSENFGFYGRAMNQMLALLRNKAQTLRPRYWNEYQQLAAGFSEEDLALPIFQQIQEMIGKDRFGAAESFMQQVRNGNLTIGNGELSNGVLNDFLNKVDRELYQKARLNNNKSLAAVFQSAHRRITNTTQQTGANLLKAWPNGALQPEKIKVFFTELDQQVLRVTGDGSEYVVTLQDKGIVMDYPHPIAAFGSFMDHAGIDVSIINGSHDADGLLTEIEKILRRNHSNRPMLLFVNSALLVPDRRKLAKSVSRITSSKPFLLLDRCLALYLADTPKTDRWKTLLRCSLPFRVINPYFENSSMPIPPDMFIGRRKEIQDIISPDGPNLLYGGRQLGKTAILRRVEFQRNRPTEGNWAAYVDIRDLNHADAVKAIARTLSRNGFLPPSDPVETWRELMFAIENRLLDDPGSENHTLLLMLDEADNLLKLFEEEGFQTLGNMKRLQQSTNGRFKFVLAGLHNVLRFSKKALGGNSVLPHLGGITIQPMKFSDGRELLEVPLSYLGFTIDQGQEDIIAQILHNTNYFPGLIHFYASRLVEHMKETSSEVTTPPYKLSRDALLRMIGDESFRKQRTDKLMMTLKVDEKDPDAYYYTLANALALCSYESEDVLLRGARAGDIRNCCIDIYANCRVGKLTDQQVEALLDELVILNILRREQRNGDAFYKFSRSSFLEMLGAEDDVLENLMDTLDKESKKL